MEGVAPPTALGLPMVSCRRRYRSASQWYRNQPVL